MKYIISFIAIFSSLNISANSLYNSNLVRDFIDEMHDKHNFDKEELQKLFNTIKEEKNFSFRRYKTEESHYYLVLKDNHLHLNF